MKLFRFAVSALLMAAVGASAATTKNIIVPPSPHVLVHKLGQMRLDRDLQPGHFALARMLQGGRWETTPSLDNPAWSLWIGALNSTPIRETAKWNFAKLPTAAYFIAELPEAGAENRASHEEISWLLLERAARKMQVDAADHAQALLASLHQRLDLMPLHQRLGFIAASGKFLREDGVAVEPVEETNLRARLDDQTIQLVNSDYAQLLKTPSYFKSMPSVVYDRSDEKFIVPLFGPEHRFATAEEAAAALAGTAPPHVQAAAKTELPSLVDSLLRLLKAHLPDLIIPAQAPTSTTAPASTTNPSPTKMQIIWTGLKMLVGLDPTASNSAAVEKAVEIVGSRVKTYGRAMWAGLAGLLGTTGFHGYRHFHHFFEKDALTILLAVAFIFVAAVGWSMAFNSRRILNS